MAIIGNIPYFQTNPHFCLSRDCALQVMGWKWLKHAKDHCDFGVWGCCYDAHETPLGSFEVFPRTLLARVQLCLAFSWWFFLGLNHTIWLCLKIGYHKSTDQSSLSSPPKKYSHGHLRVFSAIFRHTHIFVAGKRYSVTVWQCDREGPGDPVTGGWLVPALWSRNAKL